jgi:hypothetical protein
VKWLRARVGGRESGFGTPNAPLAFTYDYTVGPQRICELRVCAIGPAGMPQSPALWLNAQNFLIAKSESSLGQPHSEPATTRLQ